MPGPERQEKQTPNFRKPYGREQRNVRFSDVTSVIATPVTPLKDFVQSVNPASADHRFQKRSAVQRRRRNMLRARGLMDVDLDSKPYEILRLQPTAPVPTSMAMPNSSDSGEWQPAVTFPDNTIQPPSDAAQQAIIDQLNKMLDIQRESCKSLGQENMALRKELGTLSNKYEILLAMVKKSAERNLAAKKETMMREVDAQEETYCDADDECEPPISVFPLYRTPAVSPSSSPVSSAASDEEVRTPLTMPVREIDEDYDEGYDPRASRLMSIRSNVQLKYGLTSSMNLEQTIDQMAASLAEQWTLGDDEKTVGANRAALPDQFFPYVLVPPMPQVNI